MDIIKAREELIKGKTIYDMNLRVADLCRVSTDKDEQLNSLDNQVNYFSEMINNCPNWTHIGSYVDEGISGTSVDKRKGFLRMIEDAKLGKIDLILTKEISRFSRNTVDSIKYTQLLLSCGVIVYFLSDNINTIYPDSEFRLTLMASMAQDEVRKLSERVKFGMKRMIKDGKLIGGGNITGYNKNKGKLVINEEERPIIETLFNLYVTGEYGFAKIGEKLAEMGYFTTKGRIFSDTTLKKILQNPRYKGFYTANKSYIEDYKTHKKIMNPKEQWICYKDENIPPIISEELWDEANRLYEKRKKHWNKYVVNKTFYLEKRNYTSKLFCKDHDTTFIRYASGKRKENPTWQCNEYLRHGLKGCKTPIIYEKHLDNIFEKVLNKFITNKEEYLEEILLDYKRLIKENNQEFNVDELREKIKEQETIKERLFDMSLRKLITDDEFVIKKEKINKDINKLKIEINKYETEKEDISLYENICKKIREFIEPKLDIKNNIEKYVNLFIDKVFVSKINNDRKHLKLEIVFNFNRDDEEVEVDFNESNNGNNTKKTNNTNNRKEKTRVSFDNNFFTQKYLLLDHKQSRVCCFRSKTWY